MKDVNLGKTQSPVSPQQRRQWWWDLHQNDTHSIYFLMIPTLLVTSHTGLELYGFDVNYVPAISKYSIFIHKISQHISKMTLNFV